MSKSNIWVIFAFEIERFSTWPPAMNWKTAGRQVELVGKMAQFTSDMVEKTTVVLRVGSVVLHPGTSLKKGPIGLSEVIFVDSGIFLQTVPKFPHASWCRNQTSIFFGTKLWKLKSNLHHHCNLMLLIQERVSKNTDFMTFGQFQATNH